MEMLWLDVEETAGQREMLCVSDSGQLEQQKAGCGSYLASGTL